MAHTEPADKNYECHGHRAGGPVPERHATRPKTTAFFHPDGCLELRQTDPDDVKMDLFHFFLSSGQEPVLPGIGGHRQHVNRVACPTCHISTYARNAADAGGRRGHGSVRMGRGANPTLPLPGAVSTRPRPWPTT